MNKILTVLIATIIGSLIIVSILISNGYAPLTPKPTNQQQNKEEQEPVNSEVAEGKTCDSDGLDYYTKGELTVCDFETYEEPGSTSPIGCALHVDFCLDDFDDPTGKELYEFYCEGDELKFKKYTCPNGCQGGACIK